MLPPRPNAHCERCKRPDTQSNPLAGWNPLGLHFCRACTRELNALHIYVATRCPETWDDRISQEVKLGILEGSA